MQESFVFKSLMLVSGFNSKLQIQLLTTAMEALILERLTASPRILTLYGYCGISLMEEVMVLEVDDAIIPTSGYANRQVLEQLPHAKPQNRLSAIEKLILALGMAESLADAHGFQDGIIVQGDNNIQQFMMTQQGQIKLGDFNLATIVEWNDKEGQYCKRERRRWMESVSVHETSLLVNVG